MVLLVKSTIRVQPDTPIGGQSSRLVIIRSYSFSETLTNILSPDRFRLETGTPTTTLITGSKLSDIG